MAQHGLDARPLVQNNEDQERQHEGYGAVAEGLNDEGANPPDEEAMDNETIRTNLTAPILALTIPLPRLDGELADASTRKQLASKAILANDFRCCGFRPTTLAMIRWIVALGIAIFCFFMALWLWLGSWTSKAGGSDAFLGWMLGGFCFFGFVAMATATARPRFVGLRALAFEQQQEAPPRIGPEGHVMISPRILRERELHLQTVGVLDPEAIDYSQVQFGRPLLTPRVSFIFFCVTSVIATMSAALSFWLSSLPAALFAIPVSIVAYRRARTRNSLVADDSCNRDARQAIAVLRTLTLVAVMWFLVAIVFSVSAFVCTVGNVRKETCAPMGPFSVAADWYAFVVLVHILLNVASAASGLVAHSQLCAMHRWVDLIVAQGIDDGNGRWGLAPVDRGLI